MAEEKKQTKERRTFTLKPINIAWIEKQSLDESTPEDKVSASELVDRLIDEARQSATSKSPSKQKKTAQAAEFALVA
jgi:hypothetical protein